MKQNSHVITIPDPCHENWDAMTPAQQGRYCGACQKVVVDFTQMTDGQILEVFKKAGGRHPCGRYLPSQLDRPLLDNRPKTTFIGTLAKRIAAMVLLVQSASTAMAQQAKNHMVTVEQYHEYDTDSLGRIQVSGKLIDTLSKQPLPHMSVYIREVDTTVFTDVNGLFSFAMPAELDSVSVLVNHKTYTDNTGAVTVLQYPSLPIPEQTVAITKTPNGGEMTIFVRYELTSFSIYNPGVIAIAGASPGPIPIITTVDWLKNRVCTVYSVVKGDSASRKPIIKLPKDIVAARSEKTVWGRLSNYWMGKKN